MKMKQLYAPMVMAVMSALVNVAWTDQPKDLSVTSAPWMRWTTTGSNGVNLNGKMFTLSRNGGGISFYPPYFYPSTSPYPTRRFQTTSITTVRPPITTPLRPSTTSPFRTTTSPFRTTTSPFRTTTSPRRTTTSPCRTTTSPRRTTTSPFRTTTSPRTTYPPWTTAIPTRGVSVCLRYLIDFRTVSNPTIFTLSPSSRSLMLKVSDYGGYTVNFYGSTYRNLLLRPDIMLWSNIRKDIWTRVCLTVDSRKNVAQVFSGSEISIRKILPFQYVWSGKPVIDISGFDGQVTDIQVWDYPLLYREVYNYMTNSISGSYPGSVLTWSSISYSPRGYTLLEDAYEWQAKKPISIRGRGRRPKGEEEPREFFSMVKIKAGKRQQLK